MVVTVNAGTSASGPATPASARIDWAAVDAVIKGTSLPVIVKGITRPQDAKEAVARGAKGVVVSNYRGGNAAALTGTLLLVAPVVQAVGDQVPVLVDGSFRRGTDILKALGFGAKGVLIGRPVMWGLAAYGADGVQGVVEMLQTELGAIYVHVWPSVARGGQPQPGACSCAFSRGEEQPWLISSDAGSSMLPGEPRWPALRDLSRARPLPRLSRRATRDPSANIAAR